MGRFARNPAILLVLMMVAGSCSDGNSPSARVTSGDDAPVAAPEDTSRSQGDGAVALPDIHADEPESLGAAPNPTDATSTVPSSEAVVAGEEPDEALLDPGVAEDAVAGAPTGAQPDSHSEAGAQPGSADETGAQPGASDAAGAQAPADERANASADEGANAPAEEVADARPGVPAPVALQSVPDWMSSHIGRPRTTGPDMSWFDERGRPDAAPEPLSGGGGCNLNVSPGDGMPAETVRLNLSPRRCKNVYLALRYNTRRDFVRLIHYLRLSEQAGVERLVTAMADPGRAVSIQPMGDETTTLLAALDAKLDSPSCEMIEYFGVQLACFNKVTAADGSWKEDNLRYMIPYLTISVYSSSVSHRNLMLDVMTHSQEPATAHGVLDGYRSRLFDATNQALLCRNYKDTLLRRNLRRSECADDGTGDTSKCYETADGDLVTKLALCNEVGVRAHSFGTARDTEFIGSFYCPAMLGGHNGRARQQTMDDFWFKKFEYSTITYHETLHAFGEHSTNYEHFDTMAHLSPCPSGFTEADEPVYPGCVAGDYEPPCGKADWDWRSIHGSQISLLLSMSMNDALGCDERQKVYENARDRTATKLCQPVERTFDVPAPPPCMAKQFRDPPPATPAIPDQVRYDGCETTF